MILLGDKAVFPPVEYADLDGLLAVGGDITVPWLDQAYKMGIFPWYNDEPILWWSPDPRFVLFPSKLKVSKSLAKTIAKEEYHFEVDTHFREVMEACQKVKRSHQDGTWIQDDMLIAYDELYHQGKAHCAAIFQEGVLVAGLYGMRVGRVFSGESMFHHVRDMSKVCLALYVQRLQCQGVEIIDCQVHSSHLESLGAEHIPRLEFLTYLDTYEKSDYQGPLMEL